MDYQQYLCSVLHPSSIHSNLSDSEIPYPMLRYAGNERGLCHLCTSSTAPYLSPTLVLLGPVDRWLMWELQILLHIHRRFQPHNGHHHICAPASNIMAVANGPKQKTCPKWHLWDGNRVRKLKTLRSADFTDGQGIEFVSSRPFASYTQLLRT